MSRTIAKLDERMTNFSSGVCLYRPSHCVKYDHLVMRRKSTASLSCTLYCLLRQVVYEMIARSMRQLCGQTALVSTRRSSRPRHKYSLVSYGRRKRHLTPTFPCCNGYGWGVSPLRYSGTPDSIHLVRIQYGTENSTTRVSLCLYCARIQHPTVLFSPSSMLSS